jgi:GntR family transcriptional regulator, transcriptional repressor for pyruvate dehydrogenase complex
MPRKSLAEDLAEDLLSRIIDGRYPAGSALPSELELAQEAEVSRLTVREAINTLRAKNVVRIQRGRGTYVNPPDRWTALESVLRAARSAGAADRSPGIPYRLLEARRIIEVSVAELAAARRSDDDLDVMENALANMQTAAGAGDVDGFVEADIAFHQAVLDAAGNPFISALFDPLGQLLVEARRQTSAHADIRQHAIEQHRNVLSAIRSRDPEQARWAMHGHLRQTEDDLGTYVFDRHPAPPQPDQG